MKTTVKITGVMRVIMTVLLTATVAVSGVAKPARRGVLNVEQPDGSTLEVRLHGDAFNHLYTTVDGYPLLYDENLGYVYARVAADGALSAGPIRATNVSERPASASLFLQSVDRSRVGLERGAGANRKAAKGLGQFPGCNYPVTGEQKVLVILVEFNDIKFGMKNNAEYDYSTIREDYTAHDYFSDMLAMEGFSHFGGTGSCRDWFLFNSRDREGKSQFIPEFDVYGPVTLERNVNWYGANDSYGNDKRVTDMVREACVALDDEIDYSEYDRDHDGVVDNVYIFYAGFGEADGGGASTIWPHSWEMTSADENVVLDGVKIDRYACSNETDHSTKAPDGIGTFTHEFSHVMGLPDLYATTYSGAFTPGAFSVMDYGPYNNNGRTPPNYSSFERYALGWIKPRSLRYQEDDYTLPVLADSGIAYKIECFDKEGEVNPNEFFLLEARPQTGFDAYLPGHGMLVWHVDYNATVWANNTVNNSVSHQYVDLVEANGSQVDSRGGGFPFPGDDDVTEYAVKGWGRRDTGVALTDIREILNEPSEPSEPTDNSDSSDSSDNPDLPVGTILFHATNVNGYDKSNAPDLDHPEPLGLTGESDASGQVSLRWEEPLEEYPAAYNIYRDDVKVNEEPVTDTEYVENMETGRYVYTVTALYGDGVESVVSRPLEMVVVCESGVASVERENDILGIYSLQGVRLPEAPAKGAYILRTTAGAYKITN